MIVKHETFPVPITERFHQAAQALYQHHRQPQKRKQVYLNALSVQAVQFYLACLGIETSLEQSESWNSALQVLADTADLWVSDRGRLECRPVLPNQSDWVVPSEVHSDRVGYVFVQLNAPLTEATLLGFLPQLSEETVTLDQLQPLENFPAYLDRLAPSASSAPRVALQPWLSQVIAAGWTDLKQLMADWQAQELAYSFRTSLAKTDLIESAAGAKQGKYITLGETLEEQILLIVGVAPTAASDVFQITVELYPTRQTYLPTTLQLMIMDEANTPVLQALHSDAPRLVK
ncbi:MAG: DUF1822 family protein, partial [Leptolyngbya sp. SIO4C1]|nr:DUF1822 family protein [Leptolyngbya sp. SIO4C1]